MNAIAAVNLKGYIGKGGDLMYNIKEDMAFFARTTKGKTMVMGRRTLLSLPGGKGLKNRTNIVLSRTMTAEEGKERDVLIARDVNDLFELLRSLGIPEAQTLAQTALRAPAPSDILASCRTFLVQHTPDLLDD